jgi:hypothetical protein
VIVVLLALTWRVSPLYSLRSGNMLMDGGMTGHLVGSRWGISSARSSDRCFGAEHLTWVVGTLETPPRTRWSVERDGAGIGVLEGISWPRGSKRPIWWDETS